MLLLSGLRRVFGRSSKHSVEPVVIEHEHAHDHEHPMHGHTHPHTHDEHEHEHAVETVVQHTHTHRHVAAMPRDPFLTYGAWSAVGIGLLHGIGAETPTQVLVFAAAANAGGTGASVGVLLSFIVGLLAANTVVAATSTYGFRALADRRWPMIVLSIITATFSLVVGTVLLFAP
jgi:ABC-type nickel/cobalt efflux system permease component RcnA